PAAAGRPAVPGPDAGGLAGRLGGLSEEQRHDVLLDLVRTHAAAVLGHADADAVQSERGFLESGFDSLTATDLAGRLAGATGVPVVTTDVFDHPNPAALADHLRGELFPDAADGPSAAPPREPGRDGTEPDSTGPDDDGVLVRLETATADELFAFIDTDLGRAAHALGRL
ncbi:acyl carrier protein, partial [Actinomadura roseirufa]|uniref:acyl carrier protein n=1 Tax=Actinomadura roseirufa TaxID=2094049 RepID=UPI0010415A31